MMNTKAIGGSLFSVLWLCAASQAFGAETPVVPDWALPGSPTHKQVPPPPDFRRPSKNFDIPIGVFDGQSEIGSAVVAGGATFDAGARQYTINSAGYNIWYTRDEFRFLWKKMSGDVSLAADIAFPNPNGFFDRKVVLIIRQDLDDDAKEVLAGLHGAGLLHLAQRVEKGATMTQTFRTGGRAKGAPKDAPVILPKRVGIEKRGDAFTLYVSNSGEPMQAAGTPYTLHFSEPFYVGIGFCSHVPDKVDTGVVSNVLLENTAGKVK
jgi:hypothetical protein